MSELKISAEARTLTGRKVNQLRRQGLVPVVVYGAIDNPANLQVEARELERALHEGGGSQVVQIDVKGGSTHNVLVKDIQREPVTHSLWHADFYAVNMNETQQVSVPIISTGKPEALVAGLMLLQSHEMVHIEALPADIPAEIIVDVAPLTLDEPLKVADLPAIEGVTYLDDPETIIFTLQVTRAGEAEAAEEIEEEEAEPEVVKKGKHAEEEEEEED
ncbi:MAG: 50S ribosomal protein L25 [Caldilineaceae bacterium]|nr:50S ribosomal protein L25 [Caldilineaceae bacterium]